MSIQTKYRPVTLRHLVGVGNQGVRTAIRSLLQNEEDCHCFLLHGPSGTGKTTLGRIIANRLGVYDPDSMSNPGFIEINASDFRGIDTVRSIKEECSRMPLGSSKRVFLLDECHQLTSQAQEMFLKLLEETVKYNYFIFCTTEPQMLKDTFKRRCVQYKLTPLTDKELREYVLDVAAKEGVQLQEDVADIIVDQSYGSIGIALGLLESVKHSLPDEMKKIINDSIVDNSQVIELCRAIAADNASWASVNKILYKLKEQGEPAENIRRAVLAYTSNWLLKKDAPKAYVILDAFMEPVYNSGFPGIVHAAYTAVNG